MEISITWSMPKQAPSTTQHRASFIELLSRELSLDNDTVSFLCLINNLFTFSVYRVGSPDFGVSAVYSFAGLKERPKGGYRYAVFGDMGNLNARSLGRIQRETQSGEFDAVLHVGDMAYDMDSVSSLRY
jgi:hypothetical protein